MTKIKTQKFARICTGILFQYSVSLIAVTMMWLIPIGIISAHEGEPLDDERGFFARFTESLFGDTDTEFVSGVSDPCTGEGSRCLDDGIFEEGIQEEEGEESWVCDVFGILCKQKHGEQVDVDSAGDTQTDSCTSGDDTCVPYMDDGSSEENEAWGDEKEMDVDTDSDNGQFSDQVIDSDTFNDDNEEQMPKKGKYGGIIDFFLGVFGLRGALIPDSVFDDMEREEADRSTEDADGIVSDEIEFEFEDAFPEYDVDEEYIPKAIEIFEAEQEEKEHKTVEQLMEGDLSVEFDSDYENEDFYTGEFGDEDAELELESSVEPLSAEEAATLEAVHTTIDEVSEEGACTLSDSDWDRYIGYVPHSNVTGNYRVRTVSISRCGEKSTESLERFAESGIIKFMQGECPNAYVSDVVFSGYGESCSFTLHAW